MKENLEREKNMREETSEKSARIQRELERKMSELKRVHLSETQDLLKENGNLLNRIQILQRKHTQFDIAKPDEPEQVQETELTVIESAVSSREKLLLESKLKEIEELNNLLSKEKEISGHLHQEIAEIVSQQKKYQKENVDLDTVNKSLTKDLMDKEKLLATLMQDVQKERSIHHQMVSDAKYKGEEHVAQLLSRVSSLESQISKRAAEYLKESGTLKEKVKQYGALIKKLRFRLEAAGVKEKELEAKHEVFKQDFVPSYQYRQMQQKLQHMMNKHSEFKAFIQGLGNKQENFNQVDEFSRRMNFINEKLLELESAQKDVYSTLETL